jgi:hypothetical protein
VEEHARALAMIQEMPAYRIHRAMRAVSSDITGKCD